MSLKSNFILMAEYNASMNLNLYNACAQLTSEALLEDRHAFFGSVFNTLNHILVGDTIWLKRFACHAKHYKSLDYVRVLPKPSALDVVLYADFEALKEKRKEMDEVILLFAQDLIDTDLSNAVSYTNSKGVSLCMNFGHVVQHFFNHQTHHRGQVTTLLSQQGVDVGMTDLLMSIPEATAVS